MSREPLEPLAPLEPLELAYSPCPNDTFIFTPPANVGQVPFARPDTPPAKPSAKPADKK